MYNLNERSALTEDSNADVPNIVVDSNLNKANCAMRCGIDPDRGENGFGGIQQTDEPENKDGAAEPFDRGGEPNGGVPDRIEKTAILQTNEVASEIFDTETEACLDGDSELDEGGSVTPRADGISPESYIGSAEENFDDASTVCMDESAAPKTNGYATLIGHESNVLSADEGSAVGRDEEVNASVFTDATDNRENDIDGSFVKNLEEPDELSTYGLGAQDEPDDADKTDMVDGAAGGREARNDESSMFSVVSTFAYLIGVPKRIFENEHEPPKMEVYEALEQDKRARIVRNLCMLRTAVERNFGQINQLMRFDFKNLDTIPEYVPTECIRSLLNDGVSVVKTNTKLNRYIIQFNTLISDRINNCKELFPLWLNWEYIRELFIMPDGMSEKGIRNAANEYITNRSRYPYQVYMNWHASDDGNILHNDKKFMTLLYSRHGDRFTDLSKVSDVRSATKNNIYDFLNASIRTVLVVDCENSDPYKLCATLRGLDNASLSKIVKIILYDDIHASSAWGMLSSYTDIPVKHIINERIKQNKSLVDINLTAGVCKEFYQYDVDSFIIVSSDSDYWGLISSLPEANFLMMVEREKCGPDIKSTLKDWEIFYCYIDDFYSGDTHDIMISAMIKEVRKYLDARIQLNVNDMMEEVYKVTRVNMTEAQRKQFYDKFIKPMSIRIDDMGNVTIALNK